MQSIQLIMDLLSKLNTKFIHFIEKNSKLIPFASFLVFYLKLPLIVKMVFTLVAGIATVKVFYVIGFLIAQSRAKNEVLSIINAYENPIEFDSAVYYFYGFIYGSLLIAVVAPFIIGLVLFKICFNKEVLSKLKEGKLYKLNFFLLILFYIWIEIVLFYFMLQYAGYIPYILMYQSKYQTILELIIRQISGANTLQQIEITSYELLNNQIKYSLLIEETLLFSLIAISIIVFYNRKRLWYTAVVFTQSLLIFILLFVLLSHTIYEPGNLGKSIANYDIDYVSVSYNMYGKQELEGVKIYQNGNYLIVRDGCNKTHSIYSDQIHIISMSEPPTCKGY